MARFYSNENFPLPAVKELRELGHDVLTVQESGKAGIALPDEDVLAFAAQEQRAVLTMNRKHFVRLHGAWREHPGILACTFDANFAALARRIHKAVQSYNSLAGKLIRVNRPA